MKTHIVQRNETLGSISSLYFNTESKYYSIYQANPFLYNRYADNLSSNSVLYPGEVLSIPIKEKIESIKPIEQDNKIQIRINNEIFNGWSGITINLSLDEIADTFSLLIPYENDIPAGKIFNRFKYQKIKILYDNDLILSGVIPTIRIESGDKANSINLQGYSLPGVLKYVNLTPNMYPRKKNNISLRQIAEILCEPFGFGVEVSGAAEEQANMPYEKLEIGATEKIGSFLIKLAKDRNLLLSNTAFGDLFIDQIIKGANESLNILKPEKPERKSTAVFDGNQLYKDLYVITSGDEQRDPSVASFQFRISEHRPVVIENKTLSKQNLRKQIENMAQKALADAQVIESSIPNWLNNKDELLRPGQVVTIKDPSLQISEDERHIIKNVELTASGDITRQAQFICVLEAAVAAV